MQGRQHILPFAAMIAVAVISGAFFAANRPSLDAAPRYARGFESISNRHNAAVRSRQQSLESLCREKEGRLCRQLGGEFSIITRPPFILGGNCDRAALERWYTVTVEPAWQAMTHRYFQKAPDKPIAILLFTDEATYRRWAERLFFDRDVSRFGYYKLGRRTVLANVAWGDGPLLHELTHALMASDFPDAADWLSEGLASLHESSRVRQRDDGPILEGQLNWRLKFLKGRMKSGSLPSLERLVGISSLHNETEALNYAQARCFCMFLQQKGLLADVYHRCRARHREDPRGRRAVLAMFPGRDWHDLDAEFQQWLMSLSDP